MRILNLYCGIGGNRKLWGDDHQITAIEFDESVAAVYKKLYPNDTVIVADAHEFLLNNYLEYDFIWSSPPCQSHSSMRHNLAFRLRGSDPVYPDMSLYEEIIFMQENPHFKGVYVIENVKPYYTPLIAPTFEMDRHLFWSNKFVKGKEFERPTLRSAQIKDLEKSLGFDLKDYKLKDKRQKLRNCVNPPVGEYILNEVMKEMVDNIGK